MNRLIELWKKASNIGVNHGEENQNRETILSNKIIIISVTLVLLFIPLEIILNGYGLVPVEIFCGILFLSVLYFNHKGYQRFAKYFIVVFAVLMIGLMTLIVGGGSNSEFVLIALTISPMLLFKQMKDIILMVFFVAVSFFIVRYLSDKIPAIVEVSTQVKQQVKPIMIVMSMSLLFFQVYYFKQLNSKYQTQLLESNKEIELRQKEILDSIVYAKRIQSAILPSARLVKEFLPQSFIIYKPKDIVAGDFYWMEQKDEFVLFAAADCTGHGVPGAMVSVVCNNGLNRSVREYGLSDPGKILDKTRDIVISEFEKSDEDVKDGMDISLCALNLKTNTLQWSGANNPLWIIRSGAGQVEEFKANKQPIGKYSHPNPFITHQVQLSKGDTIYVFTDGYQDQFGGERGKKFKAAQMKELLVLINHTNMEIQRQKIEETFDLWKGELEQIDDVCVIGVRV